MSDSTQLKADNIDVAYVADLARIRLTPGELRDFEAQLDRLLDYFKELRQLDVFGVEPTAHAITVQNVFRKDEPRESLSRERVLENAPSHAGEQFSVPKIVE
jgi:aspartyl-tRNA(Asn)/glutamyl-tRNA(Gln) amidotransferase subunit C